MQQDSEGAISSRPEMNQEIPKCPFCNLPMDVPSWACDRLLCRSSLVILLREVLEMLAKRFRSLFQTGDRLLSIFLLREGHVWTHALSAQRLSLREHQPVPALVRLVFAMQSACPYQAFPVAPHHGCDMTRDFVFRCSRLLRNLSLKAFLFADGNCFGIWVSRQIV